jgi:hypothetical protein
MLSQKGCSSLQKRLIRTCLWAIFIYFTLSLFTLFIVPFYGQRILPYYRRELSTIAPQYNIRSLTFDQSGTDPRFNIRATYIVFRDVFGGRLAIRNEAEGSVNVMVGLQHLIFVLIIPLAWPGLKLRQRLISLLLTLPALVALDWADTPWGLVTQLDLRSASTTGAPLSNAEIWFAILNAGGRPALSILVGLLACGFGYFIEGMLQAKPRPSLPQKHRRTTQRRPVGNRMKFKQL